MKFDFNPKVEVTAQEKENLISFSAPLKMRAIMRRAMVASFAAFTTDTKMRRSFWTRFTKPLASFEMPPI